MTLRKTLLSTLLLSFAIAGNVSAETPKEKFDSAVQYYKQQNYQTAFSIFKELAEQGDALPQFSLGLMYAEGQGVNQDYHQAVKWYQKAAEQGDAKAQVNLGVMYVKGHGFRQDKSKAKYYLGLACDNGEQIGCDNYRILNEQGY